MKARDREHTVRSLSGPITFKRNYHYCEECKYAFYPVDRLLNLPEEGELTSEMEKPPGPRPRDGPRSNGSEIASGTASAYRRRSRRVGNRKK